MLKTCEPKGTPAGALARAMSAAAAVATFMTPSDSLVRNLFEQMGFMERSRWRRLLDEAERLRVHHGYRHMQPDIEMSSPKAPQLREETRSSKFGGLEFLSPNQGGTQGQHACAFDHSDQYHAKTATASSPPAPQQLATKATDVPTVTTMIQRIDLAVVDELEQQVAGQCGTDQSEPERGGSHGPASEHDSGTPSPWTARLTDAGSHNAGSSVSRTG